MEHTSGMGRFVGLNQIHAILDLPLFARRCRRILFRHWPLVATESREKASSETQGRSVGPGEKARQKFSSTGGKAPGYRLSPCLRRRRSKPSVYSVCELVHNIVFESHRVARTYVGVFDWLVSYAVCD